MFVTSFRNVYSLYIVMVFYFGFECKIDMYVIKTGIVLRSKYDLSTNFTNNPRIYEYTE